MTYTTDDLLNVNTYNKSRVYYNLDNNYYDLFDLINGCGLNMEYIINTVLKKFHKKFFHPKEITYIGVTT